MSDDHDRVSEIPPAPMPRSPEADSAAGTDPTLAQTMLAIVKEMGEQRKALQQEHERAAKERKSEHRWRLFFQGLFFGSPILLGILYFVFFLNSAGFQFGPFKDVVGVVRIRGEIGPGKAASADKVVAALEEAFVNAHVKAVVLSIDSGGGAPVEAERIYSAFPRLKQRYDKPLYAVIENVGASAAYMIAMHADKVIAGKMSLVGSIGAIMTPWQVDRAMARVEVSQRVYASGKLKAFMNPFTAITPEMDAKAKQLVHELGAEFVKDLRQARGASLKAGYDYGTGEVWSGVEAKDLGLVDTLGTLDETVASSWSLKTYDFGPKDSSMNLIGRSFSSVIDRLLSRASEAVATPAWR